MARMNKKGIAIELVYAIIGLTAFVLIMVGGSSQIGTAWTSVMDFVDQFGFGEEEEKEEIRVDPERIAADSVIYVAPVGTEYEEFFEAAVVPGAHLVIQSPYNGLLSFVLVKESTGWDLRLPDGDKLYVFYDDKPLRTILESGYFVGKITLKDSTYVHAPTDILRVLDDPHGIQGVWWGIDADNNGVANDDEGALYLDMQQNPLWFVEFGDDFIYTDGVDQKSTTYDFRWFEDKDGDWSANDDEYVTIEDVEAKIISSVPSLFTMQSGNMRIVKQEYNQGWNLEIVVYALRENLKDLDPFSDLDPHHFVDFKNYYSITLLVNEELTTILTSLYMRGQIDVNGEIYSRVPWEGQLKWFYDADGDQSYDYLEDEWTEIEEEEDLEDEWTEIEEDVDKIAQLLLADLYEEAVT